MTSPSHLPPVSEQGVVTFLVSEIVDAPEEKVWSALLDFERYSEWNPFMRSMYIVDEEQQKTEDQTLAVGKLLRITTNMPPSMRDDGKQRIIFCKVVAVQPEEHRVAWRLSDSSRWLLWTERWQCVSTVNGKTLYESREVMGGSLAYVVKSLYTASLREAFTAMARGLKQLCQS